MLSDLVKAAAALLGGNVVGALLGLASVVIVGRSTGIQAFGVLMLISATAQFITRVLGCQSGNAVIKFGTPLLIAGDISAFGRLAYWSWRLECAFALLAASLSCCGLAIAVKHGAISGSYVIAALLFCLSIGLNWTSTSSGILRSLDRYRPLAIQSVAGNVVKLVLVAVVAFRNGDAPMFGVAMALGDIAGLIYVACAAAFALRMKGISFRPMEHAAAAGRDALRNHFVWTSTIHSAVKSGIRDADVLIVGSLAGTAAAGAFRLAKQIGGVVLRASDPVYQVVFPALTVAFGAGDRSRFRRLLLLPVAIASAVLIPAILLFVWIGRSALETLMGVEFGVAFSPTSVYLVGVLIASGSTSLHPALLAMGKPSHSLRILVVSTAFYLVSMVAVVPHMGPVGASIAFVGFYGLWALLMTRRVHIEMGKMQVTNG